MIFAHRIRTGSRREFVEITEQVQADIVAAGIDEGLCLVFVTHTTAAVTINENADPTVPRDILDKLARLVPPDDGYHHLEGNSDAHIQSSLFGASLTLPVTGGRPVLGTWQGIFLVELDGPRTRTVQVKVMAG